MINKSASRAIMHRRVLSALRSALAYRLQVVDVARIQRKIIQSTKSKMHQLFGVCLTDRHYHHHVVLRSIPELRSRILQPQAYPKDKSNSALVANFASSPLCESHHEDNTQNSALPSPTLVAYWASPLRLGRLRSAVLCCAVQCCTALLDS